MYSEYSLLYNITLLYTTGQEKLMKPIFLQVPIKAINEQSLHPGDHVKVRSQHFLVESVASGTFSAYTVGSDEKVDLVHGKISASSAMVRIECDLYTKFNVTQTLKRAAQIQQNESLRYRWKNSEYFVTAMKCGSEYSLRDSHYFALSKTINTEYILVTPNLQISKGDHLVIRDYQNPNSSRSVLVYSCPDQTRVSVNPKIAASEVIDLTLYPEVYRVDYSDSLPNDEALLRGKSKQGEEVLRNHPTDHSQFVMWAKTGQISSVSIPSKIATSRHYEKIASSNQIQIGSHLLQHVENSIEPTHQRHLIVTECVNQSNFKVISCQRGFICEQVEELKGELYNIKYPSDLVLPVDETIRRVREQVGQQKYNPWDRVLFITHAKLKENNQSPSEEIAPFVSISSDRVLYSSQDSEQEPSTSHSLPISKSRIMCFAQVSHGDYIVKVPNNTLSKRTSFLSCHYLVASCDDCPTQCTVIESNSGKIVKLQCTIEPTTDPVDKHPSFFYRINYEPGACIPPEESIKRACKMIGEKSHIGRDRFVHFMKTGKRVEVSVAKLPDERDYIQQRKLNSCSPFLGQPSYSLPIASCNQVSGGTHIFYRHGYAFPPSYHSALVLEVKQGEQNKTSLEIITNTLAEGIHKQSLDFSKLQSVSKVVYLSSRFSPEKAIVRAKQYLIYTSKSFYHPEYYNSHHFVTMCMTGCEYSLADILVRKQVLDYEGVCVCCLLYTSPSPRDATLSRMPSSA